MTAPRILRAVSFGIAAAALVTGACARKAVKTDVEVVPVLAARVEKREMPIEISAIGNVEALQSVAVQARVSGEIDEYLNRYRASFDLPVELVLRARFNPQLDKGWFMPISNVITSITMLSIILTGAALIREREHGTIEHLLVMPVTPTEIMVSKIWSMGLVVLVASGLSIAIVVERILQVPIEGSLTLFLAGTALQLFATTCMGIFLATIAGSMPQFGLLLMLVLLPLQALSGGMTPRESMPEIIQNIMLAAPNTHFVILAQAVLFRDAGLDVVWPQLLALLVIGAILFAFAMRRFRAFLK